MIRSVRKIKTIFLFAGLFVFIVALPVDKIFAQSPAGEKSYNYSSISVNAKINEDSTVNIEERQAFNYQGEFHQGWRDIPLTKIDAITDISVINGETGQALTYSSRRLDKLNPASWGKFTYFRENGNQNIEWYYNLKDTAHTWILKYKIHGSLEFNKNSDRFYWNIFTSYDVPVLISGVNISLPQKLDEKDITLDAYRSNAANPILKVFNPETGEFIFSGQNFSPHEAFTVDITWPKGIVNQSSFWLDFIKIYYGIILSILVALAGIIIGFIRWLKTEKFPKDNKTVVAEYEPPEHLKPAMAEIITTEKLTNKGLSASLIDLAVRGYVKIEEDKSKDIGIMNWISMLIPLLFVTFIVSIFLFGIATSPSSSPALILIFPVLITFAYVFARTRGQFKNYTIHKIKEYENDPGLENYEKEYLRILFGFGNYFSTREMKKSSSKQRIVSIRIHKLSADIIKETESETAAFDVGPSKERIKTGIWVGLFFAGLIFSKYLWGSSLENKQIIILTSALIVVSVALWAFIKFEARLSAKGRILKDDWLGFKLYLKTAEKYRMQNLTPDLFEKYLPYAMIFGVEKKWAKNFETMHLAPPNWYGSTAIYGSSVSSGGTGSFSPTGFSSSFTSSFTSAFGSSGASGGGGGGAGGGGGGGGGGAS